MRDFENKFFTPQKKDNFAFDNFRFIFLDEEHWAQTKAAKLQPLIYDLQRSSMVINISATYTTRGKKES